MQSKAFPVSPFLGHLLLIAILICAFLIARGMTIILICLFIWQVGNLAKSNYFNASNYKQTLLFFPIIAWMCLSYLWASDPQDAITRLSKTIPLLLIGLTIISSPSVIFFQEKSVFQRILIIFIITSICISCIFYFLLLEQYKVNSTTFDIYLYFIDISISGADLQRNGLLMGFIGITLLLSKKLLPPIVLACLFFVTLSVFLLYPNDTAIIAFLGAMIVWGLAKISFKLTHHLFQISLICLPFIFMIFALNMHSFGVPEINDIYYPSVQTIHPMLSLFHRFYIWSFVSDYILQSPFLGWGIDASRHIPGGKDLIVPFNPTFQYLPLHPHNAVLHILFELGFIGYLLVLFPLFAILDRISKLADSYCRNMALTAFAYTCLTLMSSYGIWQSWLISAIFVFAALWRFLILFSQLNLANQASSHAL